MATNIVEQSAKRLVVGENTNLRLYLALFVCSILVYCVMAYMYYSSTPYILLIIPMLFVSWGFVFHFGVKNNILTIDKETQKITLTTERVYGKTTEEYSIAQVSKLNIDSYTRKFQKWFRLFMVLRDNKTRYLYTANSIEATQGPAIAKFLGVIIEEEK